MKHSFDTIIGCTRSTRRIGFCVTELVMQIAMGHRHFAALVEVDVYDLRLAAGCNVGDAGNDQEDRSERVRQLLHTNFELIPDHDSSWVCDRDRGGWTGPSAPHRRLPGP